MLGQATNAVSEQRDLHVGRAGIGGVEPVLFDDSGSVGLGEGDSERSPPRRAPLSNLHALPATTSRATKVAESTPVVRWLAPLAPQVPAARHWSTVGAPCSGWRVPVPSGPESPRPALRSALAQIRGCRRLRSAAARGR